MKKYTAFVTVLLFQFVSFAAFSQLNKSKILTLNTTFHDGTITMLDGSKRSGQVNFNDNEGIVAFHDGNEVN